MNYDDVCKLVGHLYISSTNSINQLESKVRDLTILNQKLQNSINESNVKGNVNESIPERTIG